MKSDFVYEHSAVDREDAALAGDGRFDGKVIDGHCHLASTRYVPDAVFSGLARNSLDRMEAAGRGVPFDRLKQLIRSQYQDHNGDRLIKEMGAANIESAVLLVPDFTYEMECELPYDVMVDEHVSVLQRHPGRFYLFYGVDPRYREAGLARFKRLVDRHGLDGIKLYPPCGYSPSDPELDAYYDICATIRAPVLSHTGPTFPTLRFSYAHPALIDGAAHRFPTVNFILAHGAVTHSHDALYQAAYRPNVFLDASGYLGIADVEAFNRQFRAICAHGIAHKIIFGTDWPIFRGQGDLKQAVERFVAPDGPLRDQPNAAAHKILRGTIAKLIRRSP